ncbi:MAG: XdhC family protein [Spirochaetaceae bacterium]
MTDILSTVLQWVDDKDESPVYAATVTAIEGSAVRGLGATMAVSATGKVTGSVSGGCIEPVLIRERERLLKTGKGERKVFCPNDDEVFGAPSPCGGTIELVIYPIYKMPAEALHRKRDNGEGIVWAVVNDGPEECIGISCGLDEEGKTVVSPSPGGGEAPPTLAAAAERVLQAQKGLSQRSEASASQSEVYNTLPEAWAGCVVEGEWTFFVSREPPKPRLIIVGGSHIGVVLCDILRAVGWRSVVVDPREAFSQAWRFSRADTLLHTWPGKALEELGAGEDDAIAAITHNERMDDEAVAEALRRGSYYVGVLGGRDTQRTRRERLMEMGFTKEDLSRIHGPIGMDIGGKTPEEIALSIVAELVSVYRGHYE